MNVCDVEILFFCVEVRSGHAIDGHTTSIFSFSNTFLFFPRKHCAPPSDRERYALHDTGSAFFSCKSVLMHWFNIGDVNKKMHLVAPPLPFIVTVP